MRWVYCNGRLTDLLVDFIHGHKVVHILQVYVDFHDLLPGGTGGLKNIPKVLDALSLQRSMDELGSLSLVQLTVCSLIPPGTTFPSSTGVWPLRNIKLGTFVACATFF